MLKILTPEEIAREKEQIKRNLLLLRECKELIGLSTREIQKRQRELIISNGREYLDEVFFSRKYLEEANGNIELAAELMI